MPAIEVAVEPSELAAEPSDFPMLETALIGAVNGVIILPRKPFCFGGSGCYGGGDY